MLHTRDGPGPIRVILIATFRLLPEHPDCSACVVSFYCYVFANIAFYNGCIAKCSRHSNTTIVKSNVIKHIAITPSNKNEQC